MAFNPDEHITKLPRKQKNKQTDQYETVYDEYLEVKWRLVWFRDAFPHGSISTEEICVDLDREMEVEATRWVPNPQRPDKNMKETYMKKAKGYARYKAIVKDGQGGEATGTKSESAVDFPDYIEKAETGAIGRALAALGFGTQFTGDEFNEKHRIVDSPVKEDEPTASHPTADSANHPAQSTNTAPRPQARTQPTPAAPAKPAEQKPTNGNGQAKLASIPTFNGLRKATLKYLDEMTFEATLKDFIRDRGIKPDHEFTPDDVVELQKILMPMIREAKAEAAKATPVAS